MQGLSPASWGAPRSHRRQPPRTAGGGPAGLREPAHWRARITIDGGTASTFANAWSAIYAAINGPVGCEAEKVALAALAPLVVQYLYCRSAAYKSLGLGPPAAVNMVWFACWCFAFLFTYWRLM